MKEKKAIKVEVRTEKDTINLLKRVESGETLLVIKKDNRIYRVINIGNGLCDLVPIPKSWKGQSREEIINGFLNII